MISCIENSLFLYRKFPQSRVSGVGVSQSFAKFREKFARGAAGAEISRNLPLSPLHLPPSLTQYTCTG